MMEAENQSSQRELPPFLFNAWRFGQHHENVARKKKELDGWTVSSLVETYLKYQLNAHKTLRENRANKKSTPPSLLSTVVGSILEELNKSDEPEAGARGLAEALNTDTLQHLLRDPRLTYRVLRAFHSIQSDIQTKSAQNPTRVIDIDEAILRNERYIRSRGEAKNQDGKYLVRLSELYSAVGARPIVQMLFARMDPPKGGLELLDERRDRFVFLQRNDRVFTEAFEIATGGMLRGLDWANVLAAGGKVLGTLCMAKDVAESDVDLYICGLDGEQANQKVRHIYQVWSDNLPASAPEKLVIKNSKTINFLASYPYCRVQVVLKLVSSPTEALLNFDLDVCAVGFDGSRVLMLPRCARAIETGYSVFTMDLIWGHHLSNRRETQESRVFKYADRGFGLRILPSYAKSLEEDSLEQQCCKLGKINVDREYDKDVGFWVGRDRKPHGSQEPGLKTLKRVAYLGQDYIRRLFFGATPLAIFPTHLFENPFGLYEDRLQRWQNGDYNTVDELGWGDHAPWQNEDVWSETFARAEKQNERRRTRGEIGTVPERPTIRLSEFHTRQMRQGLPDGSRGLGSFELFMRHCEAWRLDAVGYVKFDRDDIDMIAYDLGNYDDLPTYKWNSQFQLRKFADALDNHNDELFNNLKQAIMVRLPGINPDPRVRGCKWLSSIFAPTGIANTILPVRGYLTRRIRRQIHGTNLESVFEKQITIPLMIPWDLENYILTKLPQDFPDLPADVTERKLLIPVHDASKHDHATALLPSLQDVASEKGNLRYWVISNTSMWAGQHHVLDEITEILYSMFHWFNQAAWIFNFRGPRLLGPWEFLRDPEPLGTNTVDCIWHVARLCRRRLILPSIPSDDGGYDHRISSSPDPKSVKAPVPTLRESLLFRPWVFHTPKRQQWDIMLAERDSLTAHPLFDENGVRYPFPDELFWKEGNEGEWDGDGVPSWIERKLEDQKEDEKEVKREMFY